MPIPLGVILAAAAGGKALGGILSNKGKQKKEKADYEALRPQMERQSQAAAMRASLMQGVLKAYGLEGIMPPGALQMLTTPAPVAPYNSQGNTWGMLGAGATGIGNAALSYLQSQQGREPMDFSGMGSRSAPPSILGNPAWKNPIGNLSLPPIGGTSSSLSGQPLDFSTMFGLPRRW